MILLRYSNEKHYWSINKIDSTALVVKIDGFPIHTQKGFSLIFGFPLYSKLGCVYLYDVNVGPLFKYVL